MNKPAKISIGVVVAVIIIIGLAVYAALSNLNSIVAGAIENFGSQATGTSVSVGSVDISLTKGTAHLHKLVIGNPPGYQSDYALELKDVRIGLDISSLTSDTIVMNKGVVNGMSVNAEFHGTQSNLQQILDGVQHFIGPSKQQQQPAGQKKFIVKNFRFTNGQAAVMLDAAKARRTIQIPDISVHNIGVKSGGVNAAELAKQLLQPVLQRIVDEVRGAAKEKAEAVLQKKSEELKQKAKQKLEDKLKQLAQPPA